MPNLNRRAHTVLRAMLVAIMTVSVYQWQGRTANQLNSANMDTITLGESAMLTASDAIEIANKAIEGKVELQEGSPITTTHQRGRYIVTFVHINPPGVRGADYDARVTINAQTGEVLEILGGP
jgi:hypothetical protein